MNDEQNDEHRFVQKVTHGARRPTARGFSKGTKTVNDYSQLMDTKIVKAAVDRVLATYTNLGLKGDEKYRHELRETVTSYVERLVERGEQDVEQLVANSLKAPTFVGGARVYKSSRVIHLSVGSTVVLPRAKRAQNRHAELRR